MPIIRTKKSLKQAFIRFQVLRWIPILALAFSAFVTSAQTGQPATPDGPSQIADEASKILELSIREIIGRHVPLRDFAILVETGALTATKPEVELPYMPETLSQAALYHDRPSALVQALASVTIRILIKDSYENDAKKQITDLLTARLNLNTSRGDQVTFAPFGIEARDSIGAGEDPRLVRELQSTKDDLREKDRLAQDLKKERDDLKRDLSITRRDLEKAERQTPGAGDEKTGETGAGKAGFWDANAKLLASALVPLLGLLALGWLVKNGVSQAGRFFEAGLGKVAKSLEAISAAGSNKSDFDERSPALGAAPEQKALPAATMASVGGDLEQVHRRVLVLQEELSTAITQGDESLEALILEHIGRTLLDPQPEEIERAACAMELFGRDKANALYRKLGPDAQAAVLDFLSRGRYSRPKVEILLEVAEELKTRLLAGGMTRIASQVDPEIEDLVLRLRDEDLVETATDLELDELARYFLYFDAARLGRLILMLRSKGQTTFVKAGKALTRLPAVGTATSLDERLKQTLRTRIERAQADHERSYLTFYRALVESLADEAQDEIVEQLGKGSPRVRIYLSETIVTFGTFFRLHGDYQQLIIDRLSLESIAALLSNRNERYVEIVRSLLDERRLLLINEEVERLSARGDRQAQQVFQSAKRRVVGLIKELKGPGSLADMLVPETPGLADRNQATGTDASESFGGAA